MVCVRFAPSPTGHLHIGAARTALYNWLYARHHRGKFLLRIEDTDASRSSQEMSSGILKGLQWLGLDWDEGPVFQSQRIKLYQEKAEELVKRDMAYYCYCSPDLKKTPKQWESRCNCFHLSEEERKEYDRQGRPKAIRFKVPKGELKFKDMIHGNITTTLDNIENFVLLRRDGLPTYHLSVVADDIDQKITHVIRGDDHISNTPKQILVYKALKADIPRFAHMSLILGKDKKKLSKRHGETSVLEFRDKGFLPLAVVNFLAQMSWTPGKERIYSMNEMIEKFYLDKRSGGHPIFDLEKLEWLNGQLISRMKAQELFPYVREELKKSSLWRDELENEKREWFLNLIDLLKPRNRRITDFKPRATPFLSDNYPVEEEAVEKYLRDERLPQLLPKLKQDFSSCDDFSGKKIEEIIRARADKEGEKAALFIHALRVIVLGMKVSPGIFEVLELVGKEKTIKRLSVYLNNQLGEES
ncbi:MAG: glutamate--tRNA ligase [Acidobacteriota bacterium]